MHRCHLDKIAMILAGEDTCRMRMLLVGRTDRASCHGSIQKMPWQFDPKYCNNFCRFCSLMLIRPIQVVRLFSCWSAFGVFFVHGVGMLLHTIPRPYIRAEEYGTSGRGVLCPNYLLNPLRVSYLAPYGGAPPGQAGYPYFWRAPRSSRRMALYPDGTKPRQCQCGNVSAPRSDVVVAGGAIFCGEGEHLPLAAPSRQQPQRAADHLPSCNEGIASPDGEGLPLLHILPYGKTLLLQAGKGDLPPPVYSFSRLLRHEYWTIRQDYS